VICFSLRESMNQGSNESIDEYNDLADPLALNNPAYIIQNDIIDNASGLAEAPWFMQKQKVYAQMITNKDTYMQDAGFSSFMTYNDNKSIGLLYNADKYIGKGKTDSAEIFNNNIIATNIADSLHKFVNKQYISYLRSKKLSEPMLAQLRDIATLCPFTFGDGVYIARGLLNIADTVIMNYTNICDTGSIGNKSMRVEDIVEQDNLQIILYPNPAKDMLTIEYGSSENNSNDLLFEVYDLLGKKLLVTNIVPGRQEINLGTLSQGVYSYKFTNNDKVVKKDKLVIIK
jgi:hypothetical protein